MSILVLFPSNHPPPFPQMAVNLRLHFPLSTTALLVNFASTAVNFWKGHYHRLRGTQVAPKPSINHMAVNL